MCNPPGAPRIRDAEENKNSAQSRPFGNEAGFTLIEIANVVMIVGLLTLMAYPAIGNTTNAAKRVSCMERQRQIHQGSFLYAADNIVPNGNISVADLAGNYVSATVGECPSSAAVDYDDYTIQFLYGEAVDVTCVIEGDNHGWAPN